MAANATNLYRTYIDGNSLLSFHVFDASRLPQTTFTQWPNFNNMSYGVFACCSTPLVNTTDPNFRSVLHLDDEDNRNANSFSAEENMSAWYSPFWEANNPLLGIVEGVYKAGGFFRNGGYVDTRMYLTKVR